MTVATAYRDLTIMALAAILILMFGICIGRLSVR
jgi:hypothetical protein